MSVSDVPKRRYLGLHLGGAKSDRTALVVFEVYEEGGAGATAGAKRFLVDVFDRISGDPLSGADTSLLELLARHSPLVRALGIDAPLTLPPCIGCPLVCPGSENCQVEAVRWLREDLKARLSRPRRGKRPKPIAPYSERPVDQYLRRFLGEGFGQIAVNEALGATAAAKAGRVQYLKRHCVDPQGAPMPLVEVNPTLSLAMLKSQFSLTNRDLKYYRDLHEGASVRMRILDRLNEENTVFLYESDISTLVSSLPAFYAFLCAYTAYLWDLERVLAPEPEFPSESGWVAIPKEDVPTPAP